MSLTSTIMLRKLSLRQKKLFFHKKTCSLTDSLNKVRTKLKNVIKSFEMTLNSKHSTEKLKTKNQRNRNMKSQNTERRKPSFTNKIGRKCRLI